MATWSVTVTNKGIALQTKQLKGATISFTRCVSGSGSVSIINLKEQKAVSGIAQTLSMESLRILENKYTVKVLLSNEDLTKGYNLSQIGFYANDPDEGEILFAIGQIDTPKAIPTNADSPGYCLEFSFTFKNSNNATIEITPDMDAYVTMNVVNDVVENAKDSVTISGNKTGNPITIEDSADAPFNDIAIYGKSVQDGTPTPDAPIDIESVGDGGSVVVKTTGKNICPPCENKTLNGITLTKINNGGSSLTGTASGGSFYTIIDVDIPAGKYVFCANNQKAIGSGGSDSPYVAIRSEDNTWMSDLALTSINRVRTFTANQPIKSILFAVPDGVTLENFEVYFQLENGFSPSEYEPYKESFATVPLANPLCGIPVTSGGNYTDSDGQQWICDEIDIARGVYVKRIQEIIFDGTEGFYYEESENVFACLISAGQKGYLSISNIFHMCKSYDELMSLSDVAGFSSTRLIINSDNFSTATELKNFLSTNNLIVKYATENIEETSLTDEQLTALRRLKTFESTTNIFAEDHAELSVEYFKNTDNGKSMAVLKSENNRLWEVIGDMSTVLDSIIGGA